MSPGFVNNLASRDPDQVRIIRSPLIGHKIPIFAIFETRGMAVEKGELRPTRMQVGMDIILLCDGCQFAVIEQPHGANRVWQGSEPDLVASANSVDVLVEAIMEEIA